MVKSRFGTYSSKRTRQNKHLDPGVANVLDPVTEATQFCITAGSTLIQISAIKGVRPIQPNPMTSNLFSLHRRTILHHQTVQWKETRKTIST